MLSTRTPRRQRDDLPPLGGDRAASPAAKRRSFSRPGKESGGLTGLYGAVAIGASECCSLTPLSLRLRGAALTDIKRTKVQPLTWFFPSEGAVRWRAHRAPGLQAPDGYFTSPAAVIVSRLMSQPCPTATICFSSLVWS